jgi:electron transfer flavoprotein beta subunit
MRIVVCVKQVPDIDRLETMSTDPETGTILREGLPSILNPFDEYAMEQALNLKDQLGAEVVVITMGPPQAEEALVHCLAMGADRAILVCDRALAGSDTLATSYALAGAIASLKGFDLVLCGLQAIDGDTAQVGPMLAEKLAVPQVTCVSSLKIEGRKATAIRELEDGQETVRVKTPLLASMIKAGPLPRIPTYASLSDALEQSVSLMSAADLGLEPSRLGLNGSPTAVVKVWNPQEGSAGQALQGTPEELAVRLADILLESLGR